MYDAVELIKRHRSVLRAAHEHSETDATVYLYASIRDRRVREKLSQQRVDRVPNKFTRIRMQKSCNKSCLIICSPQVFYKINIMSLQTGICALYRTIFLENLFVEKRAHSVVFSSFFGRYIYM